MSFTLRSLTYPDLLAKAVQLAARQLGEPAFPDDVWQRERAAHGGVDPRGQHPARHPRRRAPSQQAVYGSHPYGYDDDRGHAGAHRRRRTCARFYRATSSPAAPRSASSAPSTRAQADALVDDAAVAAAAAAPARCAPLPPVPEVPPLARAVGRSDPVRSRPRPTC